MPVFVDQTQAHVKIKSFPPLRIISLVPSQTELLYNLGLAERIIGITHFCIHPAKWCAGIDKIGGTKTLDIDKIKYLQPDLIIGNKEENQKDQIELLRQDFPVWLSDIYTLEDAIAMIEKVSQMTDTTNTAEKIIEQIKLHYSKPVVFKGSAVYLIWKNPYMAAGQHTYINDIMKRNGFQNAIPDINSRYPEITEEGLLQLNPDYILLSSEPYPFSEKHVSKMQAQFPNSKILLVDGETYSWYGK